MADRHREIRNRLYVRAVLHGIFAHVQIAVIEAGAEHANQYLAGTDIWNRHIVDAHNFARAMSAFEAMQTGSFHHTVHD